jgi:hypothetical protein
MGRLQKELSRFNSQLAAFQDNLIQAQLRQLSLHLRQVAVNPAIRIEICFHHAFKEQYTLSNIITRRITRWCFKNQTQRRFSLKQIASLKIKTEEYDRAATVMNACWRQEFSIRLSWYISSLSPKELQAKQYIPHRYWYRRMEIWNEYDKTMERIQAERDAIKDEKKARIQRNNGRRYEKGAQQPGFRRIRLQHQPVRLLSTLRTIPARKIRNIFDIGTPECTNEVHHVTSTSVVAHGNNGTRAKLSQTNPATGSAIVRRKFSSALCFSQLAGPRIIHRTFSSTSMASAPNDRRTELIKPPKIYTATLIDTSRFHKHHKELWLKLELLKLNHGYWFNFQQILQIRIHLDEEEVKEEERRAWDCMQACMTSNGLEHEFLRRRAATVRFRATVLRRGLPIKLNRHFLPILANALGQSPHPSLRQMSGTIKALSQAHHNATISLEQIGLMRAARLADERSWHYHMILYCVRNSYSEFQCIIDQLHALLNDFADYPLGSASHRRSIRNFAKEYLIRLLNMRRAIIGVKYLLSGMILRQSQAAPSQVVYDLFSHQIYNMHEQTASLNRRVQRWVRKAAKVNSYPHIRDHFVLFSRKLTSFEAIRRQISDSLLKSDFLSVFSRRLDFFTEAELRDRRDSLRRLSDANCRIYLELEDVLDKCAAGQERARVEKNMALGKILSEKWTKMKPERYGDERPEEGIVRVPYINLKPRRNRGKFRKY